MDTLTFLTLAVWWVGFILTLIWFINLDDGFTFIAEVLLAVFWPFWWVVIFPSTEFFGRNRPLR